MGWESARRAPHTGIRAGAFTIVPVRRRAPEPDPIIYTQDEVELGRHYHRALQDLAMDNKIFQPNLITYAKWDLGKRLKWIYAIEQQALDGLDTIGIHVVARVVMNRLEQ